MGSINIYRFKTVQSLRWNSIQMTAHLELLCQMKEGGVNRLSMGVQTFNNDLLKAIGRKHTKETAIRTIENARQVGFENMSIDFIFRLPKQTISDFGREFKMAMELDLCPHYSIYSPYFRTEDGFL